MNSSHSQISVLITQGSSWSSPEITKTAHVVTIRRTSELGKCLIFRDIYKAKEPWQQKNSGTSNVHDKNLSWVLACFASRFDTHCILQM
jgi:hypothetical protein